MTRFTPDRPLRLFTGYRTTLLDAVQMWLRIERRGGKVLSFMVIRGECVTKYRLEYEAERMLWPVG